MTEGPYELPKGWKWVRLGEVVNHQRCSIDPRRFPDEVFLLYSIPAYDSGKGPEKVRGKEIGSSKLLINGGQCLFSKLNPRIPRVWVVPKIDSYRQVASSEFMPLTPREDVLDLQYLGKVLLSGSFLEQVRRDVTGATGSRQRLKPNVVLDALIPLPPLPEQRRIVARIEELMERVREAKRLRGEAKKDADRLMQAALAEVFPRPGDPLPPGWQWVRLGEVCEHKSGIWGPKAKAPTDGFPIVRSTEIAGHRIDSQSASIRSVPLGKAQRYALQSGDILINKSSGSPHLVGWPAIFEDPGDGRMYLFSNFMLRLRVDKSRVNPWFMLYYLHSPVARANYLGAQDTTSGLRNLRVRDFMAQPIPLPPLPKQRRIVVYLDQIQARVAELKKAQESTEAELHCLEQAILDRAFRGEL